LLKRSDSSLGRTAPKCAVCTTRPRTQMDANLGFRDFQRPTAGTEDRSQASVAGEATTFMFRHIPRKYTVRDLLSALEQHVTRSALDFVYIPWDRKSTNNMGFAFVNFVDPTCAHMTTTVMQGSLWPYDSRMREMKIVPAFVQGFAANLLRYYDTVKEPDPVHCPLLFNNGKEVSLHFALQLVKHKPALGRGNVHASNTEGKTSARLSETLSAYNLPPPPACLEYRCPRGGDKVGPEFLSSSSTTQGSLPTLTQERLLAFTGERHGSHRAAQFPDQAQVHVSRSRHSPNDSFFEDVASPWQSSALDTVQTSPEYAAWLQVDILLRKLQQVGAF